MIINCVAIDNYSISFKRIIVFKIINICFRNINVKCPAIFNGAHKLAVDIDVVWQKYSCKCSFSENIKSNMLHQVAPPE